MPEAFIPRSYPRTRVAGRLLNDAQQHQYDVLRSVGGKLVQDRDGSWWREETPAIRHRVYGLNKIAMHSLVKLGLATIDVGERETIYLAARKDAGVVQP